MFAKLVEKIVKLKQTSLKKGYRKIESPIKTKIVFILFVCCLLLIFQEYQKEICVINLVNLEKLLILITKQDKKYSYKLSSWSNFFQRDVMVKKFFLIQTRKIRSQTC